MSRWGIICDKKWPRVFAGPFSSCLVRGNWVVERVRFYAQLFAGRNVARDDQFLCVAGYRVVNSVSRKNISLRIPMYCFAVDLVRGTCLVVPSTDAVPHPPVWKLFPRVGTVCVDMSLKDCAYKDCFRCDRSLSVDARTDFEAVWPRHECWFAACSCGLRHDIWSLG